MTKKKRIIKITRINLNVPKQFVKHRKIAFIISLCNVVVLLFLSYFLNNQPVFTGEDLNKYAWMEWIKDKCNLSKVYDKSNDALFVNVTYDKQLIEHYDEYGMSVGNVDITDRSKLKSFLEVLQRTDAYKYIFLDVRFEEGYASREDSSLFSTIKEMRNIVVASHSDIQLLDSTLVTKAGLSDYYSTITETNFKRYVYTKNNQNSVPLFAYHELTGYNINSHFLFYTCNHKLCYNSLFITFPIKSWSEFNEQQTKNYYNLGNDLLDNYSDNEMAQLTKGKYIVIGDMIEDMHDTYSGMKPGSVITYYAFIALMSGDHYVKYGLLLFLGIVYFLISLSLFENNSVIEKIPYIKKSQSKLIHFIASLIEYSLILLMVMIMLNIIYGITTSFIVPSIYFAIQKTYVNYKKVKI